MKLLGAVLLLLISIPAMAIAAELGAAPADMTGTLFGYLALIIFVGAYCLVPLENKIHLRKSKPVLAAAGLIWVLIGIAYIPMGDTHTAHLAIKNNLL